MNKITKVHLKFLLSTVTTVFFLVSCSEGSETNSITLIKSERNKEKHPEIVILNKEETATTAKISKDSFKEITETHEKKIITEANTLSLAELNDSSPKQKYGISKNQNDIAQNIIARLKENKSLQRRPLRIAYFNPSDRKPVANYQSRIQKIMTELQVFYGKGMERNGFGNKSFDLEMVNNKLKIHFIQSKKPKKSFSRSSNTSSTIYSDVARKLKDSNINVEKETVIVFTIYSDVARKLKDSNINVEKETVIVFQNLARIENDSFYDTDAPYYGTWNTNVNRKGFCYVVDSEYLNWKNLSEKTRRLKFNGERTITLGELASGQIGGVCHELGHAFCLNHTHSNHPQNKKFGTALMGYGNWTFKQELRNEGKGTYLSFVTATKLMGHPCFSAIKQGKSNLQLTDISLNPMNGILEIYGSAQASPELYAVIAYCDNLNKRSDYDATGWVGPVDKSGNFQLSINELEANQSYKVNLQFLHTNGNETSKQLSIKTNNAGMPLLEKAIREKLLLKPLMLAKMKNEHTKTKVLTKTLISNNKEKAIHFLVDTINTMDYSPTQKASQTPGSTKRIYLSQTKWEKAFTGYSKPRINRVHEDNLQTPWPFLMSREKVHRFGLYGHANSEYTYTIGKRWKTLSGSCSLRKDMKGSVNFIITGDGAELYNSGIIKDDRERQYNVNLEGVQSIKLIIQDAADGKNSDWGQWLSPQLSR